MKMLGYWENIEIILDIGIICIIYILNILVCLKLEIVEDA